MNITQRSYADENGDFNRLCRFIIANNAHFRFYSTWSIGRLVDWKYGLYDNKRTFSAFCNQNAQLWFDGFGELVGCIISESGDEGFAILTLPGYRFLFTEMLGWVMENWHARGPALSTEITERQEIEAAALERCGFRRESTFFTRRFDLTGELIPRFPLEEGFSIVDMRAHPDFRAQRILRADAFQNKTGLSEAELAEALKFFNYSQSGPIYHADTDLCVLSPDGQLVAGCEALIDAHNCEADIERVCTLSSYRKRGFARAVIQECLYRLKAMGMRSAYIMGYSPAAIALYGSLGAVEEVRGLSYTQNVD